MIDVKEDFSLLAPFVRRYKTMTLPFLEKLLQQIHKVDSLLLPSAFKPIKIALQLKLFEDLQPIMEMCFDFLSSSEICLKAVYPLFFELPTPNFDQLFAALQNQVSLCEGDEETLASSIGLFSLFDQIDQDKQIFLKTLFAELPCTLR